MRKTLSAKDCDTRIKLIACILFACFEAHNGSCEVALLQIFPGIEMVEEHTKKRKALKQTPIVPRPPPIDPELVTAFAALEIQATAWGDTRSGDLHLERVYNWVKFVEHNMPFEFTRIRQANMVLALNLLRGIHFRYSQTNQAAGEVNNLVVPPFVGFDSCVNASAVHELNKCLASFNQWSAAFEPFYRKARSTQAENMFESATLLRMQPPLGCLWSTEQ